MTSIRQSLFICAVLLACPLTSRAQVDLTFNPGILDVYPGGTVGFSGTLENVTGSIVYLNGDDVNIAGPGFTLDDSPFNNNAPLFLTAFGSTGDSYTGVLLNVTADTAPYGLFFGSFVVVGGDTDSSSNQVGAQTFGVDLVSAPEPSAGVFLGALTLTAAGFVNRRTRKKNRMTAWGPIPRHG